MKMKIPDGQYMGRPIAVDTEEGEKYAQLGLSKRSGTKQVLVMFAVTQGPFKGTSLPWFGYFTEGSAKRTMASLRLCGFTGDDIFEVENQKLTGAVRLSVENGEFEGKRQARVAWVNDPNYVPQIAITPMRDDDREELREALKGIK